MEITVATKELFEQYMDQFCALYRLCFHQPMTEQEVRWRYLDHCAGEMISHFAIESGRLAGCYCASPTDLTVDGRTVPAILALNTMTHPDFSGQGLFVRLAQAVYARARAMGYELMFTFPNQIANGILLSKLGWKDVHEIPTLEWRVDPDKIPALPPEVRIREDSGFRLDYSGCLRDAGVSIRKTQAYLRWRYADNPSNRYRCFVLETEGRVSSYVICKEYKERLNIVDFSMADTAQMQILFNWCLGFGAELGKTLVTVWAQIGTAEHLYLEKLGFKNQCPITYLAARTLDGGDSPVYRYENWSVRMADDNVY